MNWLVKALLAILVSFLLPIPAIPATDRGSWTLDDFEDGDLRAPNGLSWFPIADDLAGGGTVARIEVRPVGGEGSRHALRLAARLDGAGRWPFAGAWLNLDGTGRPVNLGAFEGIRLRARGPARLQVGLRVGSINFMAPIELGAEWKSIEVPFASLAPLGKVPEGTRWSPEAVQVFGITTPQLPAGGERPPDRVEFEIDDVALVAADGPAPVPAAAGPAGPVSLLPFTPLTAIPADGWSELSGDPERDGKTPALPDATRLEVNEDRSHGMLWFRVSLRETPHHRWMGMNVALDVDGDPANGTAWWGANHDFKFDRVASVWCFEVAGGCEGFIGLADAAQVAAGTFVAGGGDRLRFAIDVPRRAYVMGIPREVLGAGPEGIRLVAAVGSALIYADDVPGQGAATLR